jgi:hypothetical protein
VQKITAHTRTLTHHTHCLQLTTHHIVLEEADIDLECPPEFGCVASCRMAAAAGLCVVANRAVRCALRDVVVVVGAVEKYQGEYSKILTNNK